jgi:hypothetical protein
MRFARPEGVRAFKTKMLHVKLFLRGNIPAIQTDMVEAHTSYVVRGGN